MLNPQNTSRGPAGGLSTGVSAQMHCRVGGPVPQSGPGKKKEGEEAMSSYTKSLCVLSAAAALSAFSGVSMAGEFDGVTVNILTRPGYVIAGRLAERGKEFEAATGGKIVVTEVPFAGLFPKIQNERSTGTKSLDAGVFD